LETMGFFGLFRKRIKRQIRMKRRLLSLGTVLLLAIGGYVGYGVISPDEASDKFALSVFNHRGIDEHPQTPSEITKDAIVTLQRKFVCGSEEEMLGIMTPEQITSLAAANPDWEFTFTEEQSVMFTEHVDDLSESCKLNSYFGLDKLGNLTLYDGPPKEERVVRTFFQLDIEHLESALPATVVKQLREGIRVTDIAEYNSVLSTFSDYAVDETEKVMKQE